jgi:8-oxo-dGTP pyrophosphatase MutT (NUDIX family)
MPNYREVSTTVIIDNSKFLILQRSKISRSGAGFWNFPGGGVEEGESLEEGGARELKEEANLDVMPEDLKYIGNLTRGDLRVSFFITDKFSGKVKINEESDDYKWIEIDELDNYLFVGGGNLDPKLVEIIKEYIGA